MSDVSASSPSLLSSCKSKVAYTEMSDKMSEIDLAGHGDTLELRDWDSDVFELPLCPF
jgi:hypothetical protein